MVRLKPGHGYVAKVLTIPFMVQVIILQAFAPKGLVTEATNALLLCPVPTLCIYIERFSHFRLSEQFFI